MPNTASLYSLCEPHNARPSEDERGREGIGRALRKIHQSDASALPDEINALLRMIDGRSAEKRPRVSARRKGRRPRP